VKPTMTEPASEYPRSSPLWQLTLARLREFYREPAAVFWVYGFPLIMAMALGIAFRAKPVERITIDVQNGPGSEALVASLKADPKFDIHTHDEADAKLRIQRAKTDLLVIANGSNVEYWFDPNRPECLAARSAVDAALLRARTTADTLPTTDHTFEQPGSRYIDFLIPGLLGMNLMGGGLWGVGFVIVDMRLRKLLKRFLATPMKRSDFLLALMFSRLLFTIPEVLILLLFGWLAFGVQVQGSLLLLIFVILLGGACFAGIGLLIACRAKTIETVSGLMNLVMLPMWILSGVFFSSERFPEMVQPFIQALPLTALINALRAVMLDGAGFATISGQIAILAAWGTIGFTIALKLFRWK